MPLPINWYCWSKIIRGKTSYEVPFSSHRMHDQGRWADLPNHTHHAGNYPKIPALAAFTEETHKLRDEGGMVCPYVALEIIDQGPAGVLRCQGRRLIGLTLQYAGRRLQARWSERWRWSERRPRGRRLSTGGQGTIEFDRLNTFQIQQICSWLIDNPF